MLLGPVSPVLFFCMLEKGLLTSFGQTDHSSIFLHMAAWESHFHVIHFTENSSRRSSHLLPQRSFPNLSPPCFLRVFFHCHGHTACAKKHLAAHANSCSISKLSTSNKKVIEILVASFLLHKPIVFVALLFGIALCPRFQHPTLFLAPLSSSKPSYPSELFRLFDHANSLCTLPSASALLSRLHRLISHNNTKIPNFVS